LFIIKTFVYLHHKQLNNNKMEATISKKVYDGLRTRYTVKKWDSDGNIIDEFSSYNKYIAQEVFDKWYFNKK